jgi:hypothetical protein
MTVSYRKLFGLFALVAVGCSDGYGGGAGVVPDVVFIPAESADVSAGGAEAGTESVAVGFGTISGKVTLTGSFSPLAPLIKQGAEVKDKEVCAAVDIPDERLVLGDGNGVANVFVYLAKAPKGGKKLETPADPFVFDQKNCRFFPHCAIVPVKQVVKVLSDDSVAHNTHTFPAKNNGVNSGVAPMDREGKLTYTFTKAENVPLSVKCDYHTWMNAYQLPVDHPYAAVTDAAGSFTIADLPAGKHTFVVWHEAADGNYVERKLAVEVKAGETTEVNINYPADRLKL